MKGNLLKKSNRLVRQGKLGMAKKLCNEILEAAPDDTEALYIAGSICLIEKRYEESRELLNRLIIQRPRHVDGLNHLGMIFFEYDKDLKTAEATFLKVIGINTAHLHGLVNLGNLYLSLKNLDEAERYFQRILVLDPENSCALNNLGAICAKRERRSESMDYYRRALKHCPNDTKILSNMLVSARKLRKLNEFVPLIDHVMKLHDPGDAIFPAFSTAKNYCLWEKAAQMLPKVLEYIRKGDASLNGSENVNLSLLTVPDIGHDTLLDILKRSGQVIDADRESPPYHSHKKAMASTKRWRVGYLSPDFRNHVVNTFFRGLINHHDRDRFEVYCYSNTKIEDNVTAEYRETADVFIDVTKLSDAKLAERIHSDGIHFIVDLAGFTENSRLYTLSYCPAPVQIVYLGYPYTSGLTAIDYFISDPFVDGPKNADFFVEEQLRLPESYNSFERLEEQEIAADIPFKMNQFVTFGTLINPYKVNPEVIQLWSRILTRLPTSKIILNHPNYSLEITRLNILNVFYKNGICKDRVAFIWKKHPDRSFLRYYNDIDLALDAFPATGGTTTSDALWMGVPVVTRVGEIYPERLSYSILSNVGIDLSELIAFSETEYLEKAVALGENPERIAELHQAIPKSLKTSILCDSIRFTRHMEAAYVEGWERKFKTSPVSESYPESLEYVPVLGGVAIAVEGSRDDLNTYVLKEQSGWFDPEYGFIQKLIQPGMRLLDISAENGIYAIPLASKTGETGKLWATTNCATEARLLEKGKARNHLKNLTILSKGDKTIYLDAEMDAHDLSEIDFIRLNINTTETEFLMSAEQFFIKNNPLVMFGIRKDKRLVDTGFVPIFQTWGYQPYRLIPGLNILIPFTSDNELDAFAINLFCCKEKRADRLLKTGLLIQKIEPLSELPGLSVKDWAGYLGAFPYADKQVETWAASSEKYADWEVYWVALNLVAWSKDLKKPTAIRYAALHNAYGILVLLIKNNPILSRLMTLCRVMIDLGKREEAVTLLDQILLLFESGENLVLDEPFFALSDEDAATHPGDRFAEWLFASVLKQREKNRAFSTYFTGQEALPILETIKATGFYGPEIEKQINLIKDRFGNSRNHPAEIKEENTIGHRVSAC